MGTWIQFSRRDGGKVAGHVDGYLAEPSAGASAPGIVVLQEWWGLRSPKSHAKHTCDQLAEAGFRALAPDLYHGEFAEDATGAQRCMQALDWGAALGDIEGALLHLKAGGHPVGVVGFCMGGALALYSAAQLPEVSAVVSYYGIPPATVDLGKVRAPVLGHFGRRDTYLDAAAVDGLEERLGAGKVEHAIYRYDADHAFVNFNRPEVYDVASAQQAWERTVAFFRQHLG